LGRPDNPFLVALPNLANLRHREFRKDALIASWHAAFFDRILSVVFMRS
jgi:hypothetical protein